MYVIDSSSFILYQKSRFYIVSPLIVPKLFPSFLGWFSVSKLQSRTERCVSKIRGPFRQRCIPGLAAFRTQLSIGLEEGTKSSIYCNELVSLPKSALTNLVGTPSPKKLEGLNALAVALDLL